MELLGGVGAAIGVADVAVRTSLKLWRVSVAWRDAPNDLHRLLEDMTRAERFFREAEEGLKARSSGSSTNASPPTRPQHQLEMDKLLRYGLQVLSQIEHIVDRLRDVDTSAGQSAQVLEKAQHGPTDEASLSKRRKAVWLRNAGKISILRKELDTTMSAFCQFLVMENTTILTELRTTFDTSRNCLVSHINEQLEITEHGITSYVDERFGHVQDLTLDRFTEAMDAPHRSLLSHFDEGMNALRSNIVSDIVDTYNDAAFPEGSLRRGGHHSVPADLTPSELAAASSAAWTAIIRQLAPSPRRVPRSCGFDCKCLCHSQEFYSSWSMTAFQSVLGSIAMTYSATTTEDCDDASCENTRKSSPSFRDLSVTYHFPAWLIRVALSVFVSSNLNGSPQFNVRIINRISPDSTVFSQSLFGYIWRQDVSGLRRLLEERRFSVYDVRGDTDEPPLLLAVVTRNLPMIELLLQAQADPWQRTTSRQFSESAVSLAFRFYHSGEPASENLAKLLPLSTHMTDEDFTLLHLVVIGALQMDLSNVLQDPRHLVDINRKSTSDGFTPLHLAALRGDARAVKLLLRAGADLTIKNAQTKTALGFACHFGHYEAAKLLVQAGAPVNDRDFYGHTPLNEAAFVPGPQGPKLVALLLDNGADIHTLNKWHCEPLAFAAQNNAIESVTYLIERGAHVNHQDWEGDTVLFESIYFQRHAIARALLEQGADFRVVNKHGWGVLHHLASMGDEEMMGIFASLQMTGISALAKDSSGRTPLVLFNRRETSEQLRGAFDRLLDSVEGPGDNVPDVLGRKQDEPLPDEVFHDAQEHWPDDN